MINLLNLFFPKVCEACSSYLSDNERIICTLCRHELPVTNFHFNKDDTVKKVLYGRVQLEEATALLHFSKKGLVQQLLHNLKYRGHEFIGEFLGAWLGEELKDLEGYKSIQYVLPVPLHKTKQRRRGFNQVEKFGKEIAKALNAEYKNDVLLKKFGTRTQVFKNRIGRFDDSEAQFYIQNYQDLVNSHVLIVDDIITTGATMERCIKTLKPIAGIKVSIATMAIAE